MGKIIKKIPVLILLFMIIPLTGGWLNAEVDLHQVWAIKGCRIISPGMKTIESGNVVIRNGLIEAAGKDTGIPADAEVIDGDKLTVYPGLIDALGESLLKIPRERINWDKRMSGRYTDRDRGLAYDLSSFDYAELSKGALAKYYKNGITTSVTMPVMGIFTGKAAVFNLSDGDKADAVILKDNMLGIGFDSSSVNVYPGSLMGVFVFLKQEISDALYYYMHVFRWQKEKRGIPRPTLSDKYETLEPFLKGEKKVVFLCKNRYDILRSIKIGSEFKLDYLILDMGGEAFTVIPDLKRARAKVILTLTFKIPSTSIAAQEGKFARTKAEKETYPKNAMMLAEAGVPFAFSSVGIDDPGKFISGVATAIDSGLSPEHALKALTVEAARFIGLEKAIGTVEKGKIANLCVLEGDLFSKDAKVKYVFIDGMKRDIKMIAEAAEKPAVDVTGAWEITVEGGMGARSRVEFIQDGSLLSGKYISERGTTEFTDGVVSGKQISFQVTLSFGSRSFDIFCSAEVEGDRFTGTLVFGSFGSAPVTGKRVP